MAPPHHSCAKKKLLIDNMGIRMNGIVPSLSEFLIPFETWAKLAQQWFVCAPSGIHFEPIKKELMLLVTI